MNMIRGPALAVPTSGARRMAASTREFTFCEFFAGGGMARAGLGTRWRCLFANDFDPMKASAYAANWGREDIRQADVATLSLDDLPKETIDLAWASFPCQDLSLAGEYRGLGRESDDAVTRSGTFWPFWKLMRSLARDGRAPRAIVLENVYGCLTSHGGRDFAALASALSQADYRFGALVINAAHFVPQSRPRVFFVAIRSGEIIPGALIAESPPDAWVPAALQRAFEGVDEKAKRNWVWWNLALPEAPSKGLAELIEDHPTGVGWHSPDETRHLLGLMTAVNREKVARAKKAGHRVVGTVYRRTRADERGVKRQRAEARFDDASGCLRTPAGGSSRQIILVVEGESVRSRLLSPREAARLMGLSDSYRLPPRYNDAYHVCGDGVCVPVVRHIAANILEPILTAERLSERIAAE
ncbi:MAG TPA: DNA cytosine methyltransferase [Roseiarcus sp.]|jgi:DNA (cytosine-5)-methyltransferase 1